MTFFYKIEQHIFVLDNRKTLKMPAFATTANNNKKNVEKRTPYCDVCYKKGLPKSSYESHYPRSRPGPDGVIVCPTILATRCSYCGENGHWANEKYCRALREDNLEREQRDKAIRRQAVKEARTAAIWEGTTPAKKPVESAAFKKVFVQQNGFSGLAVDESDDDDDEPVKSPVEAPVKAPVKSPVKSPMKAPMKSPVEAPVKAPVKAVPTWSSMAAKPAIINPPEVKTIEGWTVITRTSKYVKKPDENPLPTMGEEEAMKILAERQADGYFDRDDENW